MAINTDRPIITYESIALFRSETGFSPFDTDESIQAANSGDNLKFITNVQSINFGFSENRSRKAGAIGTKKLIYNQTQLTPDVDLEVTINEDFSDMFSLYIPNGEFSDISYDYPVNFYSIIGDKRGIDVANETGLGDRTYMGFGDMYLTNISMNQSINGILQSTYSFVGSNIEASKIVKTNRYFTGQTPSKAKISAPKFKESIPLDKFGFTSARTQHQFKFKSGIKSYYKKNSGIYPGNSTSITFSGSGMSKLFPSDLLLVQADLIQSFNLNLPINRKPIYRLGSEIAVNRKAVFPSIGTFSISTLVSDFNTMSNLNPMPTGSDIHQFFKKELDYKINISGIRELNDSETSRFNLQISNARLVSQNYSTSIGGRMQADLNFEFDATLGEEGSIDNLNHFIDKDNMYLYFDPANRRCCPMTRSAHRDGYKTGHGLTLFDLAPRPADDFFYPNNTGNLHFNYVGSNSKRITGLVHTDGEAFIFDQNDPGHGGSVANFTLPLEGVANMQYKEPVQIVTVKSDGSATDNDSTQSLAHHLTYQIWVYMTEVNTSTSQSTVMRARFSNEERVKLAIKGNGTVFFESWAMKTDASTTNNGSFDISDAGAVPLNNWTLVTMTYEDNNDTDSSDFDSTIKVYINGELVKTNTQTRIINSSVNSNQRFNIGGEYMTSNGARFLFKGKLGPCVVYNKTLSATEVRENFNRTRGRFKV